MKKIMMAVVAMVCGLVFADPETYTWTGEAGDCKWSTPGNWDRGEAPVSGSKVFLKVKSGEELYNDIEELELVTLDIERMSAGTIDFGGNEITLTGGETALNVRTQNDGWKWDWLQCHIPFCLASKTGNKTTVFTNSTRFHQRANITGEDYLIINAFEHYDMWEGVDTRTAGTTINNSSHFDFENPLAFGNGTYMATFTGTGLIRIYANPEFWMDFSPTETLGDDVSAIEPFSYANFNGKVSGTRFVFKTNSSNVFNFNKTVEMPNGFMHCLWDTENFVINFHKTVDIGEFGRYYVAKAGTVNFKGANGRVGLLHALYQNYFLQAENAVSGAIIDFGEQSDDHGVIDCCGNNQTIDRIVLNSNYPIAEGTPNGHRITSEAPATLTMAATADCVCDAKFDGALSLVWAPTGNYTFSTCAEFGREMPMSGDLIVSGGTFKITGANSFPKVAKVEVANGATLSLEGAAPFGTAKPIGDFASGATLYIPEGKQLAFDKVYVDGEEVPVNEYGADVLQKVTITGGGTLCAGDPKPNGTFTWTGAAGDNKWSTAENWTNDYVDHNVPGNEDKVVLKLKPNDSIENDLENLELVSLEIDYVVPDDYVVPSGAIYAEFKGNRISFSGGENVLVAYKTGTKSGDFRIKNSTPFYLGDTANNGVNVFTTSVRFEQYGNLEGPGFLWVNANKGTIVYDMYCRDYRTADMVMNNAEYCDSETAISFGDKNRKMTVVGAGWIRLYNEPPVGEIEFNPAIQKSDGDVNLQMHSYGQNYIGKLSGTRLAFSAHGDAVFHNSITVTGPFHRCYNHGEDMYGRNMTFNGPLNIGEFSRYYAEVPGTNYFCHADNQIGLFHSFYQNSIAKAENAFGVNAVVDFGKQDDERGVMDCNGYNQTIDRIVLNQNYPIAEGTPNGHRITSAKPATVTMAATADCECDAKFDGALSLVWAPTGNYTFSTYAEYGREMPMTGDLIVSGGTFKITGANSFPNVAKVEIANGATLSLEGAAPFGTAKPVVELVTGAAIAIPNGKTITVGTTWINGKAIANGTYTTANLAEITGEGTLIVAGDIVVVEGMNVKITDEALEDVFEGEMPTAAKLIEVRTEGNGLPLLDCYVLGLNKNVASSKPFINMRKASAAGKLKLGLDNVKVNTASGVTPKFTLKASADNSSFAAVGVAQTEPEFEIDLPKDDKVKYYKIEYSFE